MVTDEGTGSGVNNKRNNDNNNNNNNNRRRNRGGGGRGRGGGRGGGRRGRGGRGRGGGRHAANEEGNNAANATPEEQRDSSNKVEKTTTENQSAGNEAPPQADSKQAINSPRNKVDSHNNIWLKTALESLGHFDPSSCLNATKVQDKSADEQVQTLTLWLEDRVIRSWNLQEREKLRNDYWNHINAYLDSLECPKGYFSVSDESSYVKGNTSSNNHQRHPSWRDSDTQRAQIVHWLIACATSEAFGDQQTKQIATTATTDASPSNEASNIEPTTTATTNRSQDSVEQRAQLDGFPLGFSTGDEEVDHILTVLRMKLLLQLEQDQKQVNSMIAQMQAVTVGKAKPLKEAKVRSHNANNKPSSSKSNHKGSSSNRGSNDNNTKSSNRQRGKRR